MTTNDIKEIAATAASAGYWMVIKSPYSPGESWIVGFTEHYASGWNGRPDFCATNTSLEDAIADALTQLNAHLSLFPHHDPTTPQLND